MVAQFVSVFLLVLGMSGCGKILEKYSRIENGKTLVHFGPINGSRALSAVLVRGAMIYIIREDATYKTTIALSDETQLANRQAISLPNGKYTFLAVGWDGASEMEVSANGLRCEIINGFNLNGVATTVTLSMSNAKCDLGNSSGNIFYPPDVGGQPFSNTSTKNTNTVLPKFCATSGTVGSAGSAVGCSSPSSDSDFNSGNHARAELLGYLNNGSGVQIFTDDSSKILGPCLSISTSGEPPIGKFPIGNTAFQGVFAARILVYSSADTSCTGTPLETINFPEGLAFPSTEYGSPVMVNAFSVNSTQVIINHGN